MGLPADQPALVALAEAVDNTGAALDSLADQLRRFVHSQTVVGEEELRRYGVRIRLEAAALARPAAPLFGRPPSRCRHNSARWPRPWDRS